MWSLLVVIALLCTIGVESQIGCGELVAEGQTCSDWQCSRNISHFCVRGVDKGDACTVDGDCYLDLYCANGTCVKTPKGSQNAGIGFVGAVVAIFCFGSSFVPIKRFKKYAGDGVFAQFCMCFGRFMFGVALLLSRENKQFYPEAALGGMFWSAGNAISVPIIQCIGMGLGIAIWGTTNMVLGWASGNFGWWGVKKEVPARPWLSYLSVAFSFLSIILFLFVEPHHVKTLLPSKDFDTKDGEINSGDEDDEDEENKGLVLSNAAGSPSSEPAPPHHPTVADIIGKTKARVIGVSLALVAGGLFGLCMDPAQKMMSHYAELTRTTDVKYTPYGFDYVFSFNVGAISFSFFYLCTHLAIGVCGFHPTAEYFNPVQHAKIILPAFANGIIGSVGSAAWFFANQNLGLIISFPFIAAGPGVVSAMWGVFVFHEIKGVRNYLVLAAAFSTVVAAALCSAFAKKE